MSEVPTDRHVDLGAGGSGNTKQIVAETRTKYHPVLVGAGCQDGESFLGNRQDLSNHNRFILCMAARHFIKRYKRSAISEMVMPVHDSVPKDPATNARYLKIILYKKIRIR